MFRRVHGESIIFTEYGRNSDLVGANNVPFQSKEKIDLAHCFVDSQEVVFYTLNTQKNSLVRIGVPLPKKNSKESIFHGFSLPKHVSNSLVVCTSTQSQITCFSCDTNVSANKNSDRLVFGTSNGTLVVGVLSRDDSNKISYKEQAVKINSMVGSLFNFLPIVSTKESPVVDVKCISQSPFFLAFYKDGKLKCFNSDSKALVKEVAIALSAQEEPLSIQIDLQDTTFHLIACSQGERTRVKFL